MVEFVDGSTIAQCSPPDMRLPISLGLDWPHRVAGVGAPLDWSTASTWTFAPLDDEAFPAVGLAKRLGEAGATFPDILVNNAGAAWGAEFDSFPESGWDKVVDLNLKTPFFLTRALAPQLRAAGASGHLAKVINIASIDGISINQMETYSYAGSKAGLIHMTKRMALRLAKDNIIVSAIAPGAFASEMNKVARDHGDAIAPMIPAGRIGTPEDMAGAAIYLASRAGDYVVGSTLIVDGGVTYAR